MIALVKALQVILALSILIFIHELGHFLSARMFGVRVEKFFLFFDIGSVKLFSTRSRWFTKLFPAAAKWETEYGIGWLPLGGYCKIAGMVDESLDMEALKRKPERWEFRTRPAWQRLVVMGAGIFNNFLLAIVVYCCIAGIWGEAYISNGNTRIYAGELARDLGFRTGDHIIDLDGKPAVDFGAIQLDIIRRDVRYVSVLRGSDTVRVYIDRSRIGEILAEPLFDLALPFRIDSVAADSPNAASGLMKGDVITAVNGTQVEFLQDSRAVLGLSAGSTATVDVRRGESRLDFDVLVDSLGRIGVFIANPEVKVRQYSVLESIPAGLKLTGATIGGYLRDLRVVATPSTGAYKSVGSFIAIGQVFPAAWDWYRFTNLLALLSIMLGVMNLLPIPGLDGGHMIFTLYEMITGRKPSDRFLQIAQTIGMVLLLALLILAFGNDIGRLL
ncbi:MAG: RIP metalloprotease RseP [Bacteroidales bacterium]|nr:RIP metalloprotease RseP [Bacteroidales bacterium]